jgi:exopolyphosphatase/guanosine-5'-triphosphate,3'-diphosphate pyrophosphatase
MPPREEVVAGVDLGSNSFHMVVARAEADGRVHILDRLRDPVRLAAGLTRDRQLTHRAVRRGLDALERFGERLRGMPRRSVRAVGTNTLRQAKNGEEFLSQALRALGHPVEIISGHEEARLIYLGVSHTSPDLAGRHLVIDIGGGSTECIIGERFEPIDLHSLYMGCVGYTAQFFGDGRLSRANFERAKLAAALEIASLRESFRELGWSRASGSSGTILAVSEVLRANGWTHGEIRLEALEKLAAATLECERLDELELPGLEEDRAAVFPGGVAILLAAFEQLRIEVMEPSSGALREGIVYELLDSPTHEDPRDRTIATMSARYKVDLSQAERVETTALALFGQVRKAWKLDAELGRHVLQWAARVHEIGLSIAYAGHHKHSAYILEHADMPGFSREVQALLAAVVGAHRRKLSRRQFEHVAGSERREFALRLALLLRLAVRLHHSRSRERLPALALEVGESTLSLRFPRGWLEERALTRADLEEEAEQVGDVGFRLRIPAPGAAPRARTRRRR